MQTIGIVGTAKNTGKTTTLTSILNNLKEENISIGVTSIGYDGEDIDNLTYLPKPRINLKEGIILASASLTFETAKLKYEVIKETDIYTPLGRILIAKVKEAGKIVLAGPNNIRDLKRIIDLFKEESVQFLFVDGAMNRMAPMYLVDKLIFSTGASRNTEINILADEMGLVDKLFSKQSLPDYNLNNDCFFIKNGYIQETGVKALLNENDLNKLLSLNPHNYEKLVLKNIFSVNLLNNLIKKIIEKKDKFDLIFFEPFRLLLSLNSLSQTEYNKLFPEEINIYFIFKPKLIGITVNPFYPKYENFHFIADYIDKNLLKKKVKESVSVPVFDILDDSSSGLVKLIMS